MDEKVGLALLKRFPPLPAFFLYSFPLVAGEQGLSPETHAVIITIKVHVGRNTEGRAL